MGVWSTIDISSSFRSPYFLLFLDRAEPGLAVDFRRLVLDFTQELRGNFAAVTDEPDLDREGGTDLKRVDRVVDELRRIREVVEVILRDGAEAVKTRAQSEYDVRFRKKSHRCHRTLISDRSNMEAMALRE